ncbi:hypothetical protein CISG_10119 [Coccidioides immitis RMSCC 3703]|uniref:Thioredoxin domain-containing protein n=2 Tax=Coccidioides immitis TaxID=5501 RepID=A0A0J8QMG7_COCIT|nr:hypothetical protein CIRG_01507 [Coccidioides immitis RMSCC 2394]KMU73579.1 hypothetical protein CISG_10119 [Coccidioides immitis RMSCC 3703]
MEYPNQVARSISYPSFVIILPPTIVAPRMCRCKPTQRHSRADNLINHAESRTEVLGGQPRIFRDTYFPIPHHPPGYVHEQSQKRKLGPRAPCRRLTFAQPPNLLPFTAPSLQGPTNDVITSWSLLLSHRLRNAELQNSLHRTSSTTKHTRSKLRYLSLRPSKPQIHQVMPDQTPSYSFDDPTLYLFTSLTAGSSHIITATSRLETILKANKIGFRAIDVATDDKARMLWGRRSKGRKLPGLVRYGNIVGDIVQIEEWNEYGELKDQLRGDPTSAALAAADISPVPSSTNTPSNKPPSATLFPPSTTSSSPHIQIVGTPSRTPSAQSKQAERLTLALKQASEEAAAKAKENTRTKLNAVSPSSTQGAEQAAAEMTTSTTTTTTGEEKPAVKTEAEGLKPEEGSQPTLKSEEKREEGGPSPSPLQDDAEEKEKQDAKDTDSGEKEASNVDNK